MTLALIIYLVFTVLPGIMTICKLGFFAWLAALGVGSFIGGALEHEPSYKWTTEVCLKKWSKWAVLCLVVANFIPSKEVTAYMLAGYGVQTVAQNDQVQELAGDGLDVLQQLMKKAKSSLEEEIEEKK